MVISILHLIQCFSLSSASIPVPSLPDPFPIPSLYSLPPSFPHSPLIHSPFSSPSFSLSPSHPFSFPLFRLFYPLPIPLPSPWILFPLNQAKYFQYLNSKPRFNNYRTSNQIKNCFLFQGKSELLPIQPFFLTDFNLFLFFSNIIFPILILMQRPCKMPNHRMKALPNLPPPPT